MSTVTAYADIHVHSSTTRPDPAGYREDTASSASSRAAGPTAKEVRP